MEEKILKQLDLEINGLELQFAFLEKKFESAKENLSEIRRIIDDTMTKAGIHRDIPF